MCDGVRALLDRAAADGWSDALERDVDDYENYLATQLERLEDMDPAHLAPGSERLMDGLGQLIEAIGKLRDGAAVGDLRSAVDEAEPNFG